MSDELDWATPTPDGNPQTPWQLPGHASCGEHGLENQHACIRCQIIVRREARKERRAARRAARRFGSQVADTEENAA